VLFFLCTPSPGDGRLCSSPCSVRCLLLLLCCEPLSSSPPQDHIRLHGCPTLEFDSAAVRSQLELQQAATRASPWQPSQAMDQIRWCRCKIWPDTPSLVGPATGLPDPASAPAAAVPLQKPATGTSMLTATSGHGTAQMSPLCAPPWRHTTLRSAERLPRPPA
jgi:hypothetical protein